MVESCLLGAEDSQVVEDLQDGSEGPGLGLTAERAVLAVLIGQLWEPLPRRPSERERDWSRHERLEIHKASRLRSPHQEVNTWDASVWNILHLPKQNAISTYCDTMKGDDKNTLKQAAAMSSSQVIICIVSNQTRLVSNFMSSHCVFRPY